MPARPSPPLRRTFAGLAGLLLLLACEPERPRAFWRQLNREVCIHNQKCSGYEGTIPRCMRELYARSGDPETFAGNCSYDPEIGAACLEYAESRVADCGMLVDQPAACAGVCGPGSWVGFIDLTMEELLDADLDAGVPEASDLQIGPALVLEADEREAGSSWR